MSARCMAGDGWQISPEAGFPAPPLPLACPPAGNIERVSIRDCQPEQAGKKTVEVALKAQPECAAQLDDQDDDDEEGEGKAAAQRAG
jgi:hypothetical protein